MSAPNTTFETLLVEAEQAAFSGWDFSYLRDRMVEDDPPWRYADRVRARLPGLPALLDLGTGGGEILSTLAPLPPDTIATEGYPPNVEVARKRLTPLGVDVVAMAGAPDNLVIGPGEGRGTLPFADERFPLVINRHTSYYPAEVLRVLAPGGAFITQQVGGTYLAELNVALQATPIHSDWNLAFAEQQLVEAGFTIAAREEAFPETLFRDIGAVAYYLKAIPWKVPDFSITGYRDRLWALHQRMVRENGLRVRQHLFYLEAVKP
jgi:SAM-dependent methyltransferase